MVEVDEEDQDVVVPGKRMTCTLSCDHRVIDGAVGAQVSHHFFCYVWVFPGANYLCSGLPLSGSSWRIRSRCCFKWNAFQLLLFL